MKRLKTQLPNTSPTARSGMSANETALIPVASSGREVTVANMTTPTQVPLSPVFSAMTSP